MGFLRDIGAPGVIVLIIAALIIFGPKRLPELGESIGKMFTSFKKSISGLTDENSSSEKEKNEQENK
ncbi:twin-arginine translocase TatA/TatE family subunit [Gemella massiliensis]|uniref:twin-arginine translocase TatA/TatE family subunit n=1 Tax=Gemella massiliensis TaxID=1909670 RepID=UPI000931D30C|nr:twin-arginine translocase TatA/TatE family subunit [Gemella massiliensis]